MAGLRSLNCERKFRLLSFAHSAVHDSRHATLFTNIFTVGNEFLEIDVAECLSMLISSVSILIWNILKGFRKRAFTHIFFLHRQ